MVQCGPQTLSNQAVEARAARYGVTWIDLAFATAFVFGS
jgi:hypothetical protein